MSIQVVKRVIDVLVSLAPGPATLTEVTTATGLPKGTVYRILTSLQYEKFVVKDPLNNRYACGPGLFHLANTPLRGLEVLIEMARSSLLQVWAATEETVTLHNRVGTDRVCVEEIRSPQPISYSGQLGSPVPLNTGAAGKIILAFLDEAAAERLIALLLPAAERHPYREELEAIRARGWAESEGERVPGAAAVSVPLRLDDERVWALSVLAPADRLPPERRRELVPLLQDVGARIEALALPNPPLRAQAVGVR